LNVYMAGRAGRAGKGGVGILPPEKRGGGGVMREFLKGVAVFTVVEIVTLVKWLALAIAMQGVRAVGVLFGGLFVEHVIQGVVRARAALTPRNLLSYAKQRAALIAVFTAVETAIWVVARLIEDSQYGAARLETGEQALLSVATFFFLFGTLVVKHALAKNVFDEGRVSVAGFRDGTNILGSALEALGAAVWLAAPSVGTIAVMAVTSYVEHYVLTK